MPTAQKVAEVYVDGIKDEMLLIKDLDALLEGITDDLRVVVVVIVEDRKILHIGG